jgi:hypothetical protein
MKLHHHHLTEADRTADHLEEVHQSGREVAVRTAAAEEVRHIAAEVGELRIAVAAVVDLDPVVRTCVSLVIVLSSYMSKETHIISWLSSLRIWRL